MVRHPLGADQELDGADQAGGEQLLCALWVQLPAHSQTQAPKARVEILLHTGIWYPRHWPAEQRAPKNITLEAPFPQPLLG